jgi:NADH-quinone oxidoreductase subunit M
LFVWYSLDSSSSDFQFLEEKSWINDFIKFKLGVDGISILFIVLTTFITPLCIISVNNNVKVRLRDFLIAILIMESFMIGVFCSLDKNIKKELIKGKNINVDKIGKFILM